MSFTLQQTHFLTVTLLSASVVKMRNQNDRLEEKNQIAEKEGSDGENDEQKKYKTFRKNKVKLQK